MATVGTSNGRITWHELLTPGIDRAVAFYRELLGWDVELSKPEEGDYPIIHAGGAAHGGFQRTHHDGGVPTHWLGYVRVDDVDRAAARARELGGAARVEPLDVDGVGRLAVVQDPGGAEIAVLAPDRDVAPPAGVFVWDELATADVSGATPRFYAELFGWTAEPTGAGTYAVFRAGAAPIAGLTGGSASAWIAYVATPQLDEAVTRARESGARVVSEPTEVEGVGRAAVIEDPGRATVGLVERSG
jgi:predicted enzyme related to lactoylglutathione lyase